MDSPETLSNLENEFYALVMPQEWISSAECQAGKVYWISARRISSIAICRGTSEYGVTFIGLREKLGDYYLFDEVHYDDSQSFGTACPFVELGDAPEVKDDKELMEWFLDQEITLAETRLEWLGGMPAKYKDTDAYKYMFEDSKESLRWLRQLKDEGFDAQERITFKSILAKAKNPKLPKG